MYVVCMSNTKRKKKSAESWQHWLSSRWYAAVPRPIGTPAPRPSGTRSTRTVLRDDIFIHSYSDSISVRYTALCSCQSTASRLLRRAVQRWWSLPIRWRRLGHSPFLLLSLRPIRYCISFSILSNILVHIYTFIYIHTFFFLRKTFLVFCLLLRHTPESTLLAVNAKVT